MYVFGIGLNKTGTTSLDGALDHLGWRCLHHASRVKKAIAQEEDEGLPLFSTLIEEGFTAFCDSPVWRYFRELDAQYPGSRFVYTTRPVEDWISSRQRHIDQRFLGKFRYKHWEMDPEALRRRYAEHDAAVREYFDGREDILIMDVCSGEGWEKLCPFLDKAVPDEPFPWRKKARK